MPLVGYLKTSDGGRISSITNLDGDKKRRKKIYAPVRATKDMYLTLYVYDCSSHEPRGAVVPVQLKRYEGEEWISLGVASCCPLCWRILVPPVGVELPEPQTLDLSELQDEFGFVKKGKKTEVKRRRKKNQPTQAYDYQQKILELAKRGEITVQDGMLALKLTRTATLRYFTQLVKARRLVKTASVGGKGVRSRYKLA